MPAEQATPPASMRQYLAALLTLAVVIGFGLWREMAHLQEPALRGSLDDDSAAHDQEEAAVPKGKDAGGVPEDSDLGKALGRLDELLNKHDNFLSDAVAQARRDVDTADAEFPETEEDAGQGERGETHTARLPAPSTAHQWYGKPAARSHGASNLHRRSQHPAATAKESSVQGSASDPEEESSIGAAGLHGGGELDEEEQKEERQYQRRHNHLHDKVRRRSLSHATHQLFCSPRSRARTRVRAQTRAMCTTTARQRIQTTCKATTNGRDSDGMRCTASTV